VCDADVFEGDVEFVGALEQVGADAVGNGFTLGDEFCGVKLRDNGFEDFVADGGEDTLVVVEAEVLSCCVSFCLERQSQATCCNLVCCFVGECDVKVCLRT